MYSYSVKTFGRKVHASTGVFMIPLVPTVSAHHILMYFVEARNISTLSSVCTSIVNHFSDRSLHKFFFSRYSRQVSHNPLAIRPLSKATPIQSAGPTIPWETHPTMARFRGFRTYVALLALGLLALCKTCFASWFSVAKSGRWFGARDAQVDGMLISSLEELPISFFFAKKGLETVNLWWNTYQKKRKCFYF